MKLQLTRGKPRVGPGRKREAVGTETRASSNDWGLREAELSIPVLVLLAGQSCCTIIQCPKPSSDWDPLATKKHWETPNGGPTGVNPLKVEVPEPRLQQSAPVPVRPNLDKSMRGLFTKSA